MGWHRWVGSQGRVLGLDRYGASAPAATVFEKFGLTVDNVVKIARRNCSSGTASKSTP